MLQLVISVMEKIKHGDVIEGSWGGTALENGIWGEPIVEEGLEEHYRDWTAMSMGKEEERWAGYEWKERKPRMTPMFSF